jgi:peptidoglycan-N-acetylglucosamine deacetylase
MDARLVLAAGAAAWTAPALAPVVAPVAGALGLRRRLDRAGSVALTFDDGPHPEGTPAILEILAERRARATFFVVGEQVERHPGICEEILAAGHSIGVHGHRHRNQLRLTPRQFALDLDRALETVGPFTGEGAALYRPPYGIFSPAGLRIVRSRSLRSLLWSRWAHDWRARIAPESIAAEATEALGQGDVILLHDADHYNASGSWRRTAAALPSICGRIEALGLRAEAI